MQNIPSLYVPSRTRLDRPFWTHWRRPCAKQPTQDLQEWDVVEFTTEKGKRFGWISKVFPFLVVQNGFQDF